MLLVPGFLAGDRSPEPLAEHLAGAGHRPRPAGIARNLDCSETITAALTSGSSDSFPTTERRSRSSGTAAAGCWRA